MNPVEQHYQTRLNRLVRQHFDHNGQMPIEEFLYHCQYIEASIPEIPYPKLQVAETSDFHWNTETCARTVQAIWAKTEGRLAEKHLSKNALGRFKGLDKPDAVDLVLRYYQAEAHKKGDSDGLGVVGIDATLKSLRASEAHQRAMATTPNVPPITNRHGESVTSGLCLTCVDRLACYACKSGKLKCNNYGQHKNASQGPLNGRCKARRSELSPNIGDQFLTRGI
jgi:hypothetical protein